MRSFLSAVALPLFAVASPMIQTIDKNTAPILSSTDAQVIEDSYLVVFKDHVTHADASAHQEWVQDLHLKLQDTKFELRKRSQFPIMDTLFEGMKHTFHIPGNLLGYSGHFDQDTIEAVRRHPDVSFAFHVLSLLIF